MPKRLFVTIPPSFENWILVQPGARLPKEYGGARLVQRDQFSQEFDLFLKRMSDSSVLKVMSSAGVDSIVRKLEEESRENKRVRALQPVSPPPELHFEPAPAETSRALEDPQPIRDCATRHHPPPEEKSHGFAHIASIIMDAALSAPAATPAPAGSRKATPCAKCGGELTPKEVSYCRFNFTKLGRRYLCRRCQ